jgi:hypothetical protein
MKVKLSEIKKHIQIEIKNLLNEETPAEEEASMKLAEKRRIESAIGRRVNPNNWSLHTNGFWVENTATVSNEVNVHSDSIFFEDVKVDLNHSIFKAIRSNGLNSKQTIVFAGTDRFYIKDSKTEKIEWWMNNSRIGNPISINQIAEIEKYNLTQTLGGLGYDGNIELYIIFYIDTDMRDKEFIAIETVLLKQPNEKNDTYELSKEDTKKLVNMSFEELAKNLEGN